MPLVNLDDPKVLAEEIANGRIWSGPGWAIDRAVKAINSGKVPYPDNVPEEYAAYLDGEPNAPQHVEPDYTLGAGIPQEPDYGPPADEAGVVPGQLPLPLPGEEVT